jgi:hypothetical protein
MCKFKGGDGEFGTGVPAHDLDDAEYDTLTDEQKGILKAHMASANPLYENVDEVDEDAAAAPKKPAGTVDAKKATA